MIMIKSTVLVIAAGTALVASPVASVHRAQSDTAIQGFASPDAAEIDAVALVGADGHALGGIVPASIVGTRSAAAGLGAAAGAAAATMHY
ncbi:MULTISPECIES: hypothetical protein [Inquilinus]|uniref:Uncharacterized protein n=1 Tax=Inquilinus ginsengisoli TaxID=363840 RepID=A0ABU1JXA2_9PROT|nr:hypothetical protein [Inquilinus ginsengisoli]MDR6292928.1 hypothetical protein [Inquilinus ginsengisoli]